MTNGFHKSARLLLLLVIILLGVRAALLVTMPHTDTTEARYAEISRKMVETRNWVTPQSEYGVPYWAKPPLAFWLSAAGMKVFGVNEFGSRVFIFVVSLMTLGCVYKLISRQLSAEAALVSVMVLVSMPAFFVASGMVMTDGVLVFGTTLAMAGFWLAVTEAGRGYGYLFFLGLAVGLLAKGPLTLVLAGMPLGMWVVLSGRWKEVWSLLPWIPGTLLLLALVLPWYVIAERTTPGFLDYFIVGEHFSRFTKGGWSGDKYGKAHSMVKGMIWVFWLAGTFPWFATVFTAKGGTIQAMVSWARDRGHWNLYLLLWALCPLVFFTPAANIIASYPLPSLPASAMLVGGLWFAHRHAQAPSFLTRALPQLAIWITTMLLVAVVVILGFFPRLVTDHTQKPLVARVAAAAPPETPLVYWGRFQNPRNQRLFSAEFYRHGAVQYTDNPENLARLTDENGQLFLAIKTSRLSEVPASVLSRFGPGEMIGEFTLFSKSRQ